MPYVLKIASAVAVILSLADLSQAASRSVQLGGLSIYADLTYSASEGDFNGLQIIVVPSGDGEKVVWREASGRFNRPILLELVKDGDAFKVSVPSDYDFAGEWRLKVQNDVLVGSGPKGRTFRLRRVLAP
ncbi:hypothetical protein [Bradyrhizobium oligotrophicum]|uniref:hypothetical protein n=1 Tax=Bradyrhizobium TaxID=374 RepID=UPI003EB92A03